MMCVLVMAVRTGTPPSLIDSVSSSSHKSSERLYHINYLPSSTVNNPLPFPKCHLSDFSSNTQYSSPIQNVLPPRMKNLILPTPIIVTQLILMFTRLRSRDSRRSIFTAGCARARIKQRCMCIFPLPLTILFIQIRTYLSSIHSIIHPFTFSPTRCSLLSSLYLPSPPPSQIRPLAFTLRSLHRVRSPLFQLPRKHSTRSRPNQRSTTRKSVQGA